MMDLVIAILAVLTIPGIPVSIWFQRRSSRIRNRIVWDNVGLCKSTWLLIGAFVVSIVCAIASAVLAVYYRYYRTGYTYSARPAYYASAYRMYHSFFASGYCRIHMYAREGQGQYRVLAMVVV